jgi:hypothetical protein
MYLCSSVVWGDSKRTSSTLSPSVLYEQKSLVVRLVFLLPSCQQRESLKIAVLLGPSFEPVSRVGIESSAALFRQDSGHGGAPRETKGRSSERLASVLSKLLWRTRAMAELGDSRKLGHNT